MSRDTRLLRYLAAALAPCLVAVAEPAFADENYTPTAAVTIPGLPLNSWDISFVDPVLGQYYLGDRTNNQVDVITTATNSFSSGIGHGLFTGTGTCGNNNCAGPDGVLVVNHRELWVGDGDSTVKVFDLSDPNTPLIHTISTHGKNRADELCFDPKNNLVMVANNAEDPFPFATIISVDDHRVVKRITFDGTRGAPKATNGAEQCQYSSKTERFYIAIPEIDGAGNNTSPGGVAVINPENLNSRQAVEQVFVIPLDFCTGPQGMALGPNNQALLGCNGTSNGDNPTAIFNIRNGNIVSSANQESGSDEVWYNPGNGTYFLARSSAVGGQFLGVINARNGVPGPSIFIAAAGAPSSHSVAADAVTNQIYLPIGHDKSTICSSVGGNDKQGCIAVFSTGNNNQCLAEGAPVTRVDRAEDPVFLNGHCRDFDRRDAND